MSNATQKAPSTGKIIIPGAQRSYNEIVDHLNSNWPTTSAANLNAMKALDNALSNPSKSIRTMAIAGTNGKGLTIHFVSMLLRQEGLNVGAFLSPRILTYNEQFSFNNEIISNKVFTELANDVINTAEAHDIKVTSREIVAMIALLYFKQQNVDVALLEIRDGHVDPFAICSPVVIGITRITDDCIPGNKKSTEDIIKSNLAQVAKGTFVVSADQSKAHLQMMNDETEKRGGIWTMPIRKLAQLVYPFEQLHGRCAALAERMCRLFVENVVQQENVVIENSLLAKQKGQRGRPTLEALKAKRQAEELNLNKTIDQFWKETTASLPGHFQLLDKEKPSILLDNARNIDAIKNVLLGIRLMHYQRPLKGLTFIFGCDKDQINVEEFLRLLRYFTKKNSANIIFCPIASQAIPGLNEISWDVEKITNDVKSLKIKARSATSFKEAFDMAKETVDERNGLVVITGSQSIIAEYWNNKGMKKL